MQGLPSVPAQVPFCFSATIGLPFASVQPAAQPCFHVVKGLPSATKTCNTCCCQQYTTKTHTVYYVCIYIICDLPAEPSAAAAIADVPAAAKYWAIRSAMHGLDVNHLQAGLPVLDGMPLVA